MRSFAITYPQLMNQATACGFNERELLRLREGHELAQRLVDGLYRRQEVPFLCHLVRTASIIMTEVRSMDVIVASMLHAAYLLHSFDNSSRRRPRESDRTFLKTRIGDQAENLVQQYGTFPWYGEGVVRGYTEKAREHTLQIRQLLLMRLANELEDHLDAGAAYVPKTGPDRRYVRRGPEYIELAQALGYADLAVDLREAFDHCRRAEASPTPVGRHAKPYELRSRLWTATLVERLGSLIRRYRESR